MQEVVTREQGYPVAEPTGNAAAAAAAPMRLIEMAVSSNADIDKLERLLELQTKWEAGQARKEFLDAMAAFQSALPTIKKLKQADFGAGKAKYKYASLDDISEQIKPFLQKFGLSYRFEQKMESGVITVKCIVSHKSGHYESCEMMSTPDQSGGKNSIQQSASAITYLRRYTLTGALGIATADEDIDGRISSSTPSNGVSAKTMERINAMLIGMDKTWDDDLLPLCSKIFNREINSPYDLSELEANKAEDFLSKKVKNNGQL
ncbi:ERF family protein [Xenorhabdus bovienii]|uniref:ERF family protein n=2 Tax=Xenorhabdus bovienii TaxID=40576 RepID=UPI0023B21948|nr:ERF family protein [Xenorhabdus bovienii]MDE9519689.1 ERF family protein [Xenorhabdus bovienii]